MSPSLPPLHLSGVVLPEGEHRDVWVREGRFTFEPVPGAGNPFGGGFPGGGMPGGMPGLPPGQGLPDLTKLNFNQPGDERPSR